MHNNFYFIGTEQHIRTGAVYRMYIDGVITNINVMGKVVARDIIEIWRNVPLLRNNIDDAKILRELRLQFSDGDIHNVEDIFILMLISYDFGYMRGRRNMRDEMKGRCRV